jgi:hypothetical protein
VDTLDSVVLRDIQGTADILGSADLVDILATLALQVILDILEVE